MIHQHRRGTTQTLNRHRGLVGELTIDLEAMGLRLHDGQTPGGFQALGEQAIKFPPGPLTLSHGDEQTGYYGRTTQADMIGRSEFISLTGLTIDPAPLTNELTWLKFSWQGDVWYVAQDIMSNSVSWDTLNNAGLVHGETVVTIQGFRFKVMLLSGYDNDPSTSTNGTVTNKSEWNRLLMQVTSAWDNLTWSALGADQFWVRNRVSEYNNPAGIRGSSSAINYSYSRYTSSNAAWKPALVYLPD